MILHTSFPNLIIISLTSPIKVDHPHKMIEKGEWKLIRWENEKLFHFLNLARAVSHPGYDLTDVARI